MQTPKTTNSKRIIDIDAKVIKELAKLQATQNLVRMRFRDTYHENNFVFTSNKYPGFPIYIKFVESRMSRILKMAGLNPKLTPHSLRHTHTSLLAEARVGLQEIMDRLGHTDDETTKNVYIHVTKEMKKEASQKFSELMRNL